MKDKYSEISINENNQLIITEFFKDRLFSVRKNDSTPKDVLSYEAIKETNNGQSDLKRILLDGTWSLTEENNLRFSVLGNSSKVLGKYLILKGYVERIDGSKIGFRIRECDTLSNLRTKSIELSGRWCADNFNRLNFKVVKLNGRNDTLCFQGAWDVNKHNELVYKFTETALKTKRKRSRELILKGHWSLARNKISYLIEKTEDSMIFKVQPIHRKIYSTNVSIKYSIQISYLDGKKIKKTKKMLEIFGKWTIRKDLKVEFNIKYSGLKKSSVDFIVEKIIQDNTGVNISVRSSLDKKPCFDIVFKKPFKDDVEFFIALSKHAREYKSLAGVRVRF